MDGWIIWVVPVGRGRWAISLGCDAVWLDGEGTNLAAHGLSGVSRGRGHASSPQRRQSDIFSLTEYKIGIDCAVGQKGRVSRVLSGARGLYAATVRVVAGRGSQTADSRETARAIYKNVNQNDAHIFAVDWWEVAGCGMEKDVELKLEMNSDMMERHLVTWKLWGGGASRQVRVEGRNAPTTRTVSRRPPQTCTAVTKLSCLDRRVLTFILFSIYIP